MEGRKEGRHARKEVGKKDIRFYIKANRAVSCIPASTECKFCLLLNLLLCSPKVLFASTLGLVFLLKQA